MHGVRAWCAAASARAGLPGGADVSRALYRPFSLTEVFGGIETAHTAYQALGRWVAANSYEFTGIGREVFIHLPDFDRPEETVIEIQFPVLKVQNDLLSLS